MESKKTLMLQESEQAVIAATSRIYAAYIVSGQVREGQEDGWLQRSLREAICIAERAEDAISAEGEMG